VTQYLLDTSAFFQGRLNKAAGARVRELGLAESVAVCTPALLEMLVGARNSREWMAMRTAFDGIPRVELTDLTAAIDLQGLLARRGQHRPPVLDVLVAHARQ